MSKEFIKVGGRKKVYVDDFGHLNLHNIGISDISEIEGLAKLTSLQALWFNENQIKEIKDLDKLTVLQILYLGGNQITEIKGLDKLTSLQILYLGGNQITEIKGLDKLTSLQELELGGNQILKRILRECGGLDNYGMAKDPQKFVKYCIQQI
jgi:protein phosphatase 1 regulatory subunit 7